MNDKFQELLLLNYYQGVYHDMINGDYDLCEAMEFFFTKMTGIANEYGINTDFDVTPDGCEDLYNEIEAFLTNNLIVIDVEDEITDLQKQIDKTGDCDLFGKALSLNGRIAMRLYENLEAKK